MPPNWAFSNEWPPTLVHVGVLRIRALPFRVYIRVLDYWQLPYLVSIKALITLSKVVNLILRMISPGTRA